MNRFYFILPLIFLCTIFTAQNRTMELWPAHTFRFKLNKQFKIDIENQLRANVITGDLNQFFTQSSIKYKSKKTRLSSGFRLIQEFNNPIENHLRYHIDYSFGSDISFRIRYQTKNQLGIKKIEGDYFDNDLRYRLKVKINVPDTKLKPVRLMDSINTDGQFQENTEFLKKEKLVLTSFEKNNGCIGIHKQHGCLCPIILATLKKRNLKINRCGYRK